VRLARHHVVVWSSPDPRDGTLSRHGRRQTVAARASESDDSALKRALRVTVSRVRRRLSVPPHGSSDGSTISWCWVSFPMLKYPRAGRRGAHRSSDRYSGRNAFAVSARRSASPVTFTVSAVAVGMSTSRVPQLRMTSDSAGDGRELFRWPWNGRLSLIFSVLSTLRGGQKVTETVTYTRYLASGTCLTLCTHRQHTCGGGGDRKPRTKSF
jgi:hypothetical protein